MAKFILDDPNRKDITLEDLTNWLTSASACNDGVEWTNDFLKERHKQIPDDDINSAIVAVVNKFIQLEQHDWAEWIIIRVLSLEEALDYRNFLMKELAIVDCNNDKYRMSKNKAMNASHRATEKNNIAAVGKVYKYVIAACLHSDGNVNELKYKILTYGVGLVNKRLSDMD